MTRRDTISLWAVRGFLIMFALLGACLLIAALMAVVGGGV